MPQISIIIPTFQHGNTIEKCLESIFFQNFKNFEIIVVNDGSTDNTLQVLEKYKNRITLINQTHKGGNSARNRGFEESKGNYLLFCDADLVLKPEMLEKMFETLKNNPNKSYAYSYFKFGKKTFKPFPFDGEKLKQINFIHTTSLIRREHFLKFDEKIKKFQDWDLWLSMLKKGYTGILIPEILFKVIPRKEGISRWLPKIFYKIPWQKFGIHIKTIENYYKAAEIIKKKHHL